MLHSKQNSTVWQHCLDRQVRGNVHADFGARHTCLTVSCSKQSHSWARHSMTAYLRAEDCNDASFCFLPQAGLSLSKQEQADIGALQVRKAPDAVCPAGCRFLCAFLCQHCYGRPLVIRPCFAPAQQSRAQLLTVIHKMCVRCHLEKTY